MTEAAPDDFLSGQGVPVALADIERELTRLWGPAAEEAGGSQGDRDPSHRTRVVLANLVAVGRTTDPRLPQLQAALEVVTARHPSRTIVLRRSEEPGRTIRAEVSALCHLPAPGLPQVCSERIVLLAGPEAGDLLPGAVRPHLEADLPFVLWWACDPLGDEALFRDLGDEATRLILDLPDPGADVASLRLGLDPAVCPFARDAAWFGLPRWRELVAQFFDAPRRAALDRIDSVVIEAVAPSADAPPRLAVWLAAWLAGQLGWTPEGTPTRDGGRLDARFRGPSGLVRVEVRTAAEPTLAAAQLRTTTLTTCGPGGPGDCETFRLARASDDSPEVRVRIDSPDYCGLPRTVLAPEPDGARRVSAALESSRNDPPFVNALPHALWLLGG